MKASKSITFAHTIIGGHWITVLPDFTTLTFFNAIKKLGDRSYLWITQLKGLPKHTKRR